MSKDEHNKLNKKVANLEKLLRSLDEEVGDLHKRLEDVEKKLKNAIRCIVNSLNLATGIMTMASLTFSSLPSPPLLASLSPEDIREIMREYMKVVQRQHEEGFSILEDISVCRDYYAETDKRLSEVFHGLLQELKAFIEGNSSIIMHTILELYKNHVDKKNAEPFLQDVLESTKGKALSYIDEKEMFKVYGDEGVYLLRHYKRIALEQEK